ncbi:MAG: phosphatidate cytidylyltransferase [Saprospiraceae bacterium]|nr:MAG: phosphatidate cytidylyltransferase [Saprospiraceae bacterium]
MKGLLRRLFTAIFFVLLMLGGLYGGRYSFVLLFAIVTALCLWEFLNMVLVKYTQRDFVRIIIGMGLGLVPFIISTVVQLDLANDREVFISLSAFLVSPFLFTAFLYELYSNSQNPFLNIAFMMLGMIYIGVPFALLDFIAFDGAYFYADTVFGLLLLSWSNDTGAYVVGSLFGRTKLFPRISPKKTWEGTIGGFAITFLICIILAKYFTELDFVHWLALAGIVSVFGTLGDLVESMLKRSMQTKDSGGLLPGHGGFLDRFDGFIFMLPYATAYLLWMR